MSDSDSSTVMVHMLSTKDNPFDPFTQYDEWYAWDNVSGYHSTSLLARLAVTSDELSDGNQALAIEQAIDEIIEYNINGMFIKISKRIPKTI